MGKKHHISLISCKMIGLTLEHGLCTMTPFAFCMYGEILIYPVGDLIEGHRYGKIATLLSKRLQAKESASQLYFNVFTMVCSVACPTALFSQKICNKPMRIASSSSFLIYHLISRPFFPIHAIDQPLEGAPITKPRPSSPWASYWPGKWRY